MEKRHRMYRWITGILILVLYVLTLVFPIFVLEGEGISILKILFTWSVGGDQIERMLFIGTCVYALGKTLILIFRLKCLKPILPDYYAAADPSTAQEQLDRIKFRVDISPSFIYALFAIFLPRIIQWDVFSRWSTIRVVPWYYFAIILVLNVVAYIIIKPVGRAEYVIAREHPWQPAYAPAVEKKDIAYYEKLFADGEISAEFLEEMKKTLMEDK